MSDPESGAPESSAPALATPPSTGARSPYPPQFAAATRMHGYEPRGPIADPGETPADWAEEYHEASKMHAAFPSAVLGPGGQQLIVSPTARFRLGRKSLAHTGAGVELPEPQPIPVDLLALTRSRRSGLPAHCGEIDLAHLSAVLAACAGTVPDRPDLRVSPSAGALYPLDVVVIAHAVAGLTPGAFVYDPVRHALLPRLELRPVRFHHGAGENLDIPPMPAVTLAIVATFARSRTKYGLRGYRFALLEAGHLAQSALLAATALGLATQPWGGFIDTAVDRELELDGLERSCLYLVALSDGTSASARSVEDTP